MKRYLLLAIALCGGCYLNDKFEGRVSGDDGGTQNGPDLAPATCIPTCAGTTPICDLTTDSCAACSSNTECASLSSSQPLCAPSGACVACISNSDCPTTNPICNTSTGTCGQCTDNSQCASGVCYQSTCLAASTIVYVNGAASNCPAGPSDGSMTAPYCIIQDGFSHAGTATKPYVVVMPGTYQPATGNTLVITNPVSPYNVTAIGIGTPVLTVSTLQGDIVVVTNTGTNELSLSFDGFSFRGASNDNDQGAGNGSALAITGGTDAALTKITVTNSKLDNSDVDGALLVNVVAMFDSDEINANENYAFDVTGSTISITNCTMSGDWEGTVFATSTLTMDRDIVTGSRNGGLAIQDCQFTVTNTLLHHNGMPTTSDFPTVNIGSANSLTQPNQTLFNVTVADNSNKPVGIVCDSTVPNIVNTVVYNTGSPTVGQISMCNPSFSSFAGGGGSNENNNSCTANVFVNPTTNNYLPMSNTPSPCSLVGLGVDSFTPKGGTLVTTNHDLLGNPRKAGKNDIGALQTQ